MVLPDSDRVPRVPPYSGTDRMLQAFAYGIITLCDEPFQTLRLTIHTLVICPTTPGCKHPGLGIVRVRSPLLAESRLISTPPGTEMFQFPGFASLGYVFT